MHDAGDERVRYIDALKEFRDRYQRECRTTGADYVPLDTSMRFDKALVEYLSQRKARF